MSSAFVNQSQARAVKPSQNDVERKKWIQNNRMLMNTNLPPEKETLGYADVRMVLGSFLFFLVVILGGCSSSALEDPDVDTPIEHSSSG